MPLDTTTDDAGPSILAIDTSALIRRYLADRNRPLVISALDQAEHWVASALARSEVMVALHQSVGDGESQRQAWAAVRDDWEALWEVPVDGQCLARATEIAARFGITLAPAIHLAAADRLPTPVRFLTFDRRQIPAATELGLEVLSPRAAA